MAGELWEKVTEPLRRENAQADIARWFCKDNHRVSALSSHDAVWLEQA
jgi:hypothetical protein